MSTSARSERHVITSVYTSFVLSRFELAFNFDPERISRDTSESSRDRQCDVRIAGQRVDIIIEVR